MGDAREQAEAMIAQIDKKTREKAETIIDQREREAFEKAEKVAAKDWGGEYVWSDRFQEIFGDIDDLLERHEQEDEEPPEYVWECEEEVLELDAEDILYSALERAGATFMLEHMSNAPKKDLQEALDVWLKKNPVRWWKAAHNRAVLLREES